MMFAFRMAFRDARASRSRFAFVTLAIAAGVAALTGVKGFSESVHYTLFKEARTLMGADLMIRMNTLMIDDERAFLATLPGKGIDYTTVSEMVSMTSSAAQQVPVLSSIKAADLNKYPFYGALELDPAPVSIADDSVAVSEDLLFRLNVRVGDSIKVGNAEFRIAAVSKKEPDRMTTGFTLGPRVLMTRDGYERTGLNVFGSRATQRILLRLPAATDVDALREDIRSVFKRRGRVIDYSEANPTLSRNMERASAFLSMVSLIALIVGGVGVATTIESHIQQRLDHIAIMKCLGGASRRVMQIYAAQALMLGLAGSAIGVALGLAAQTIFPRFLEGYFDFAIEQVFSWRPAVQGIAVGLLTTLLFTVPPLLSIIDIRPALIFRRDMQERTDLAAVRRRRRQGNAMRLLAGGAIVVGLWFIAVWMSGSARIGSYFAGGLVISVLALAGIARLAIVAIRIAMKRVSSRLSPVARQAVANLYRPGTHVTAILVALGVGVMFTVTVQLLQTSVLEQMRMTAPPDSPNVFVINVTSEIRDALWRLMREQPGVLDLPAASPAVAGQLSRINEISVEQIQLSERDQRYFRAQFALTWSDELPKAAQLVSGVWWQQGTTESLVSVEEEAADALNLKPGDRLEWTIQGRTAGARVVNVRRTDAARIGANTPFVLSPTTLAGFPVIYYGAIRVVPGNVGALQRTVFKQYPTVTVVNAADVLEIVQSVVDRIGVTVRFLAAFAIFGGAIILASAVAGTRFRRMREVAVLKTIGATRWKVIRMFSLEFFMLGCLSGLIGSGLSALFSAVVIHQIFQAVYVADSTTLILSTLLTGGIAVVAGWAASFRMLGQKPLEVFQQAQS